MAKKCPCVTSRTRTIQAPTNRFRFLLRACLFLGQELTGCAKKDKSSVNFHIVCKWFFYIEFGSSASLIPEEVTSQVLRL